MKGKMSKQTKKLSKTGKKALGVYLKKIGQIKD